MSYIPKTAYVDTTGDQMTGDLNVYEAGINITNSGSWEPLKLQLNGVSRFEVGLGSAGARFDIDRMTTGGAWQNTPISIHHTTGDISINGGQAVIAGGTSNLTIPNITATGDISGNYIKGGYVGISKPAGTASNFEISSGTALRWTIGKNADPESTGDVGSNLTISSWKDDGTTYKATPIKIIRSSSEVQLQGNLKVRDLTMGLNGDTIAYISGTPESSTATSKIYFGLNAQGSISIYPAAGASTLLYGGVGSGGLTVSATDDVLLSKEPTTAFGVPTKRYVDGSITPPNTVGTTVSGVTSTWTPLANWQDWGSPYTGLYLTRNGPTVTIEGLIKRITSTLAVTAGTTYNLGTVPVGFRPSHDAAWVQTVCFTGTTMNAVTMVLTTAGALNFIPMTSNTIAVNGYIVVTGTYRGA